MFVVTLQPRSLSKSFRFGLAVGLATLQIATGLDTALCPVRQHEQQLWTAPFLTLCFVAFQARRQRAIVL